MTARAPREQGRAPRTDDREGVAQLREVLQGADFTAEAVQQALTTDGAFSRNPEDFPLYLRLMEESRLATLVKLFFLGVRVPRDEAAEALAPLALERVERIGVVRLEGGDVFSTVEISPTEDFLFAYDHPEYGLDRPDHVLGMSPPTKVLACLTVRRPAERALDVGTGSGLQALLAAQHSAQVVAVDINPRALAFARFNAALNGFENVETREGSVFDPVEGEQFDLIVSNPPYVISPETDYIYRDSGLPGHSFCEGLVRRMPEFLREGGYAHVLVSWVHAEDEDWSLPLREWVYGSGCDVLLLHHFSQDPLSYAASWNRPLRHDPPAFEAALERWTAYYEALGIEAIGWGSIVLRKRAGGETWVWAHSPSVDRIAPAAHHVERLFAAQDYLTGLGDPREMLDEVFEVAPDHRLEETVELQAGGPPAVRGRLLHLHGGLRFQVAVDGATAEVLSLLDGSAPLRDVLARAAELAPPEVGVEQLEVVALPAMARLLELGFVLRRGAE